MFDWIRNLTKSAAEKQQEMLTAYVDGELTPAERQRFEQIMAADELLRAEMERQRLFKRAIQELPRVAAPRNFILNPADYRAPAPQRAVQLYPALRAATALAALFLVIVFSTSLLSLGAGGAMPEAASDVALVATDTANLSAPAETTRVVEVTRVVEAQAAAADDADADATMADTATEAEEVEAMAEAEAADESFYAEPTAAASAPAETDAAMADEESGGDAGAEGEAAGAAEAAAPRPVATETPAPRVQAAEPAATGAAGAERISATETPAGQITIAENSTTASPDIPWLSILAISLFIILLAATLIARWQKNKI